MIRKITLLCLLCFGITGAARAQTTVVHDAVNIYLPFGDDTSCPSQQLTFIAVQSVDTFSTTTYQWYTNGTYTGVHIDTFITTALADGDSAWCMIQYIDALGNLDTALSNIIVVHRSDTIAPGAFISLTSGSNPGCGATPLTFTIYPVNGGSHPEYQWFVNGIAALYDTNKTITSYFSAGDTITCQVISNSPCAAPFNDTVLSNKIGIIHDSLHATISIVDALNPICAGTLDSFMATYANAGIGASLSWYVDATLIPGALGPKYLTDTLHDGNLVYCILNAPDPCVVNHTTNSNIITMTVVPLAVTTIGDFMSHGSNPGCLDSLVGFTAFYNNFGATPSYGWYINGILVSTDSVFDTVYNNHDILTFKVKETDNGCYTNDSLISAPILMIRDSTPSTPLLSLIGDQLVVADGSGSNYQWYLDSSLIAGTVNPTYHPSIEGYYYVVKDTGNCPSLPSNVIYISLLSVKNISAGDVKLYPNPVSGMLNMDWSTNIADVKLDLYNILGQSMLHEQISNQSHHETDLSALPEGNYMLVLTDSDGNKATYKIYHNK